MAPNNLLNLWKLCVSNEVLLDWLPASELEPRVIVIIFVKCAMVRLSWVWTPEKRMNMYGDVVTFIKNMKSQSS